MVDILKQKGQVFSRLDNIKKENLNFVILSYLCWYQKKKGKKKTKKGRRPPYSLWLYELH